MYRNLLIVSAIFVMSLAASCGGGSGAPAPQAPADTEGPAITVNGVINGQIVDGDVQITAAAADASGVVDFDFEVNGTNVATENDGTLAFLWHTVGNGTDTLKFTATDGAGNSSSVEMEVKRKNNILVPIPDFPLLPIDFDFEPIPWPFPEWIGEI